MSEFIPGDRVYIGPMPNESTIGAVLARVRDGRFNLRMLDGRTRTVDAASLHFDDATNARLDRIIDLLEAPRPVKATVAPSIFAPPEANIAAFIKKRIPEAATEVEVVQNVRIMGADDIRIDDEAISHPKVFSDGLYVSNETGSVFTYRNRTMTRIAFAGGESTNDIVEGTLRKNYTKIEVAS